MGVTTSLSGDKDHFILGGHAPSIKVCFETP